MHLILNTKVARFVERKALAGIDPGYGTPSKRRNLIRLAMRDGKVCTYCKKPVQFLWEQKQLKIKQRHDTATFDHVIPARHGGTYALANGVLACHDCNNLRGDMEINLFRKLYNEGKILSMSEKRKRRAERKAQKAIENAPKREKFIFCIALVLHINRIVIG